MYQAVAGCASPRGAAHKTREMPIPVLDQQGLLPVGVHDCTWQEIQQFYCWNAHRTAVFDTVQDFLAQRWVPLNLQVPLWVDGGFTRRSQAPKDIDVVADCSQLPTEVMFPVISLWLQRDALQQTYNVDFWFKHPMYPEDLTQFFRYAGLKAAAELGLDAKQVKGILRVQP